FEQELNVWHADDTSDDDTSSLSAEPGTILLNQVVTDADGDTDGGSIDLSAGVFNIEDDGPSTSLNEQFEMPTLVVDESPIGEDEDGDNDPAGVRTATFDFSVAFGAADFGTDGPGTVEYGLVLSSEGAESGLFALGAGGAQGDAILLFTEADGSITGRTGDENGPIYFTISVVETGVDAGEVTFEQELNVWHADDSSDDDTSFLNADPGTITLEQTVTDADGDSETIGLDLSDDVFAIEDDGPSGEDPVEPNVPNLVVDESPIGEDEGGDDDPAGVRTDTASFAALFGTVDHGTDGPGTVTYALELSSEGEESGLFALGTNGAQGAAILLFTEADGSITGRTTDENGPIYFTISVVESGPGAGDVTFEQSLNVWHADDTSDDDTSTLNAEPGTILLNQVVTDADGDVDGGAIDLSVGVFHIEDDGPAAADDTDTVGAPGTTATGNVITDNAVGDQGDTDDGADDVGTDTPGRITDVVSVNEPGNTDSDADPNVFEIQGEFGVLVINANGSYTYTRDEGSPGGGEEVFTYTLTDADGDSEEANLTIQIADEVPVAGTETATVDDDGLVGSPDGVLEAGINDINANLGETPATNANEAIFNGTLNATGGDGALTFSLVEPADGAAIGQETVNYTLVGNLLTATIATSPVGARVGDTLFTVELVDPSTGDYVVTLEDNVLHGNDANEDEDGIEVQVTVLYQVEDSDGSTSVADGELTISFNDDIPTVAVNAEVEPNLEVDESDLTVDAGPTSFAGLFDVDFGADGPAATGALDFELNINTGDTGLFDTATGEEIVLVKVGETIEGRTDTTNQLSFVISVNADGELSLDQQRAIIHDDEMDPNDVETMDADSLITLSVTATDADGDSVTVEDPINIAQNFLFFDDGPTTYEPEDASVTNEAGAAVFFDLDDTGQGGNDDIGDNFGADGPGVVRFPSTLHASDSGETSGGVTIWYFLSNDGQTLTAKTGATAELAEAGTGVVFTVNLNQATDQYSVQMFGTVDNLGEVIFDEANFDFVGGNETWFGIVPNDQGPDDTPVDDESHDLLITPTNETSVNTSGILGGIDTGQSVGTGEGFRIDYVIDLTGEPAGGGADYQDGVDNGHFLNVEPGDVPSHYTTNGAFFTVRQSDGSDILIKAFDDTDNDDVVGDGSQEAITKIVIRYTIEGVNPGDDPIVFSSGELTPTTTEQFVTLNGIEFSYELDDDGMSVHVGNVQGATGANEFPNTTISTSTADGYNSLEVYWEGGQTFKFAGFGIQDQLLEPVEISLPTEIVDGDGDVVAGGDIDLTLTPAGAETLLASTSMESREAFDGGETSSFSLLSSNDTQQLEKTAANSNNVVLAAAIGAAGFVATGAAAQTPHFDVGGDFATNALVGKQALADFGGTEIGGGKFADLSSFMESGGFEFGAMAMASTSHQAMAASHIGELTTNLSLGSGPNALLEATDFGGMLQMPAPAMGMDVAMVSADALMPQVAGVNAQTTGAVEQILADALQGGGSAPDIDALLNALPGGANVGLQNLATQAGDHVPTWDMGHGDVFTFDVASIITMQAMALHPDAVQPVANG
ncbi:MAG TPA: DUF5801 repeats-in-toxin domain-containing protein, partial [Sphingomicrobium sp.]|nr:DUF5801 repeats-in-toxin domain-containing protein [Sphingomicrobium sp.]